MASRRAHGTGLIRSLTRDQAQRPRGQPELEGEVGKLHLRPMEGESVRETGLWNLQMLQVLTQSPGPEGVRS